LFHLFHLFHLYRFEQIWRERAILSGMREIFGKMCPKMREIFLGMGELILIFAGFGDAMVCLVLMLAPWWFF